MDKPKKQKGAIVLDDWKLKIYRKELEKDGYHYEDGGAFRPGISILTVETTDPLKLKKTLERAERICKRKLR